MWDALNRAERYRDLAEECRRLAATSLSSQMRSRFSRMAESYSALAEADDLRSRTCEGRRRISREHVKGRPGTRICRSDFMVRCPTYANHRAPSCSSLGGGVHVERMESGRTLPQPCRRVSPSCRDHLVDANETPLLADGGVL